ncbi:hypothetical protein AB1Y20_006179 [Prymnesium parvum]|uniref:Uncharacterized protein n=1 Tax=Prymnesium parvum TaxID=97485 RepID=A0AB34J141_PRYPA
MAERASEGREWPCLPLRSSSGPPPSYCSRCCSSSRWILCDERKGRLGVGALAFCGIARCLPLLASSLSVRRLHRIDPLVLTCRRSALVALWLLLGALPHVGASEELSPSAPPSLPPAAPEAADRSGFLITLGAIGAAVFGALIVFLPVAPILLAELPAGKVSGCGAGARNAAEIYDLEGGSALISCAKLCAQGDGEGGRALSSCAKLCAQGDGQKEGGSCEGAQASKGSADSRDGTLIKAAQGEGSRGKRMGRPREAQVAPETSCAGEKKNADRAPRSDGQRSAAHGDAQTKATSPDGKNQSSTAEAVGPCRSRPPHPPPADPPPADETYHSSADGERGADSDSTTEPGEQAA